MDLYPLERINALSIELKKALLSQARKFSELGQLNKLGLYIIFNNEQIIYIGKTGRTGKTRLQEMTADYRNHTLNRKLLKEHFELKLGKQLSTFNKSKKQL